MARAEAATHVCTNAAAHLYGSIRIAIYIPVITPIRCKTNFNFQGFKSAEVRKYWSNGLEKHAAPGQTIFVSFAWLKMEQMPHFSEYLQAERSLLHDDPTSNWLPAQLKVASFATNVNASCRILPQPWRCSY